ncbi:MAG: GMC family oxidoreductase [Acidimicrobiales bacterium]
MHDVVVVGGGSAGCVVAARLAQGSHRSVLLLEAGPDRRADLPPELRDGWTIERDALDWGYRSEPHAGGAVRPVRRKRLLGGTSWLTRFTPRGSPADYEGWKALGNPGWGFEDVLPYFVRLETDTDFGEEPWHGDDGPIPSTRFIDLGHTTMCGAAVQALSDVGFSTVADHNRPGAVGAGRMPMNVRDGMRVTTADAYLPLGATPPNLTIRADAQVDRVLFTEGGTARGVRLLDGTEVEAGWVVLCAGTFGSPPILLRSGVGPPMALREHEIDVVADVGGVGSNLCDHPDVYVDVGYHGEVRAAPVLHTIATFHSSGRPTSESPDLLLWLTDPSEGDPEFGIEVVLLRPRSRGSVQLRSADPTDPPAIELPNLDDPDDVVRLAEGYRRALEVANHPSVQSLCDGGRLAEPDDLDGLIRAEVLSLPHVVGTCAMGPRPEDGAVVDPSARVHGTGRLTVVDASIMPDVPSGFTHIPTIMLAERLSETIGAAL